MMPVARALIDRCIRWCRTLPIERPGLHGRLILLVLLAVAPGLGLLGYAHTVERGAISREAEAQATREAYQVASNHDRSVGAARQLLAALAQLPPVLENDTRRCSRLFATLLGKYPHYANLGAI